MDFVNTFTEQLILSPGPQPKSGRRLIFWWVSFITLFIFAEIL